MLSSSSSHELGEFHGLIQESKLYHSCFRAYFWMSVGQFELLLSELGPDLRRQRNNFREQIDQELHLAVHLR